MSRKNLGKIKMKMREKTQQVRESWSQQLEHKQVLRKDGNKYPEESEYPAGMSHPLQMLDGTFDTDIVTKIIKHSFYIQFAGLGGSRMFMTGA